MEDPRINPWPIFCGGEPNWISRLTTRTYFLSLAENERKWLVMVENSDRNPGHPVYVDGGGVRRVRSSW